MDAVTMDVGGNLVQKRLRAGPVVAIARFEAVRMLGHPAFLFGLLVLALAVASAPEDWVDGQFVAFTQVAVVAMGIGTLVASALVAGRERFVFEPDLFPGTPVTPGYQALGTALGLIGPALVTAVAMAVVGVRGALTDGFVRGQEGYTTSTVPPPAEWAQPVLLVVLAGVVGVIVAHLPRGRLAALVFLVPACFVAGTAGVWASEAMPLRVLHPLMATDYERRLPDSFTPAGWAPGGPALRGPDQSKAFWREVHNDVDALGWHLPYLAGLILVGVWVAARLAGRGERPPLRWPAAAGIPLVLVVGVAQMLTGGVGP